MADGSGIRDAAAALNKTETPDISNRVVLGVADDFSNPVVDLLTLLIR